MDTLILQFFEFFVGTLFPLDDDDTRSTGNR